MTYNPERLRTGNKIIRQRLKGPSVVDYYPKKGPSLRDLRNAFPGLDTWDDDEEDRLEGLTLYVAYFTLQNGANRCLNRARVRGKGAPKKKRTAEGMSFPLSIRFDIKTLNHHQYRIEAICQRKEETLTRYS